MDSIWFKSSHLNFVSVSKVRQFLFSMFRQFSFNIKCTVTFYFFNCIYEYYVSLFKCSLRNPVQVLLSFRNYLDYLLVSSSWISAIYFSNCFPRTPLFFFCTFFHSYYNQMTTFCLKACSHIKFNHQFPYDQR